VRNSVHPVKKYPYLSASIRGQISNPISRFKAISRLLPRKLQIPNKNAVFHPFLASFTRLLSYTKKMCVGEFQQPCRAALPIVAVAKLGLPRQNLRFQKVTAAVKLRDVDN
jgi:hypothetical protein